MTMPPEARIEHRYVGAVSVNPAIDEFSLEDFDRVVETLSK